jgi:hypothetical protein
MRLDPQEQRIYVRQSWIGDYLICPERSRLGVAMPQFRTGSDATAIGTGLHSAIEWALNSFDDAGSIAYEEMKEYAQNEVKKELSEPNIKLTKISDSPIEPTVDAMVHSWITEIAIDVEWGGTTELGFRYPSGLLASNGYEIWYEGTMDYIDPNGTIWDWKTAGRKYYANEKQNKAYQPTVYCQFAKRNGHSTSDTQTFKYGVMMRKEKPEGQVVDIARTESDYRWLNRQTQVIVNNALQSGITSAWPMNDQGALCSATWCNYWSICKGAC